MNINKCLKKMGLGKHESAIMRALVRNEKAAGKDALDAARDAVKKRLRELREEKSSVERQMREADDAIPETFDVPEVADDIPQVVDTPAEAVARASAEAAHSPENDKPLPTEAQARAGVYAKGHLNIFGLRISIENPKGSVRTGLNPDGQPWQVKMLTPYGYIRQTEAADGDHVDVYLGENLTEDAPVFVIDQIDPKTKAYDEAKVVMGAKGYAEAKDIYDNHFSDDSGESRRGAVTKMSLAQFKDWLKSDTTKPVKYRAPKPAAVEPALAIEDVAPTPIEEPVTAAATETTDEPAAPESWDIDAFGEKIGVALFAPDKGPYNANIPEGFEVDEGARDKTQVLERYYKQQGRDVVVTPLSPTHGQVGSESPNGVLRDGLVANAEARVRGAVGASEKEPRSQTSNAGTVGPDVALAQKLASIFGKKVVFVVTNQPLEFGGVVFVEPNPDEIFIDVRSRRAAHVLVGHELTHHMEADAPEVYAKLHAALNGLLKNHQQYYRINGLQPGEYASKEMIGDLMGDNFNKPEFWNQIADESAGAFSEIARTVKAWLDNLLSSIKGKLGFGSERFVTDVRGARSALAHALAEYALTRKTVSAPIAAAPAPQFSREINFGTLTPAQQSALRNIHGDPVTWRDRLNEFRKDWKTKLVQGLFDQYYPVLNYTKKGYRLLRQAKGGDSTLEAMLLYGKPYVDADGAYRVQYDRAQGMQGFSKVLASLNGEQDRFFEWVAAQRAERLKSVGLEHLYQDSDITALKALDQGLMKGGASRPAAYKAALQQLNDWNDNMLKIAEDSGLIDDQARAMFKDLPYVPFYRLQEEGVVNGFGMKAGAVNQKAWQKLKGGTQHLNDDLLANLLQNWSHLITASAKNRAAKEVLEAAVTAGVAIEVPTPAMGKQMQLDTNVLTFRDQGQERYFMVEDQQLIDAIAAMNYAGLGAIGKPFVAMKRALTIGVTANPAYKVRNLIRDSIQAIGTAKLSYNPAKNLSQGYRATAIESETRAQMLAGGGMIRFGSMLDGNSADRARQLIERGVDPQYILDDAGKIERFWKKHMLPAWDAYQEIGDRGEQMNRAALYEQLLADGMSHEEAAFWARDMMDFSLSGKWAAVRILTQVVPFMNARLQGIYKLGRAAQQDYKRMGTTLGAVALASIGLLLAYGDDDDWKKREDWDRDNYWWFKVGGLAIRVPKPFELGAVGTLAERSVEYMISDEMSGKRFAERISATIFSQLSMNPTPQLFKPLMDIYANKDSFSGRPIETLGMDKLRKQDRMTERTSEVSKFLGKLGLPDPTQLAMGKWSALSPVQIDSMVRGYFGWLGTSTTTALDWGIRPMMGRGERPDMKLRDVFLAGNFVETLPAGGSRYVTQLYDQAKEIEQAYGSYHDALKRGDQTRAKEIATEEAAKLAKYRLVESVKRSEAKLNAQIRQIEAAQGLPGSEKRLRIEHLEESKNRLARVLSPL